MISLKEFIDTLELEPVVMADRDEINLETSDVNRPGLQLSGFFDYFAADRLQVIGKAEMQYILALEPEVRKERLDKYMSYNIPVVVVCRNMPVPPEMVEAAQRHNVALLRSRLVTTRFMLQASMFIGAKLAPRITRHGVLMDVFGIGVMITGESARARPRWSSSSADTAWSPTTWSRSARSRTCASWARRRRWCATSWRSAAWASSTSRTCTAWVRSSTPSPSTW